MRRCCSSPTSPIPSSVPRTGWSPRTRHSWPTPWGSRSWSSWARCRRANAWRSCCTTCSRSPSTDRTDGGAATPGRRPRPCTWARPYKAAIIPTEAESKPDGGHEELLDGHPEGKVLQEGGGIEENEAPPESDSRGCHLTPHRSLVAEQARRAAKTHILVATPGRMSGVMIQKLVSVGKLRILVPDEADPMLNMGFQPQVDRIVKICPMIARRCSSPP